VATHRLDAILAPDYLEGLTGITIEDLRARRAECDGIDTSLSYARRLLQGRLDIVLAELKHRRDGTASNLQSLVEELPEILSEKVRAGGNGRLTVFLAPGSEMEFDPALVVRIDAVADDRRLSNLPSASVDEVESLVDELSSLETEISAQRSALHDRMNALQEELVRRYRSGEASVDSLLT
jgi:hypothetical protein